MPARVKRNTKFWKIKKCDFNCWVTVLFEQALYQLLAYMHTQTQKRPYTPAYTQINSHVNEYAWRNVHVISHTSLIASFMLPWSVLTPVLVLLAQIPSTTQFPLLRRVAVSVGASLLWSCTSFWTTAQFKTLFEFFFTCQKQYFQRWSCAITCAAESLLLRNQQQESYPGFIHHEAESSQPHPLTPITWIQLVWSTMRSPHHHSFK